MSGAVIRAPMAAAFLPTSLMPWPNAFILPAALSSCLSRPLLSDSSTNAFPALIAALSAMASPLLNAVGENAPGLRLLRLERRLHERELVVGGRLAGTPV